jgi:3-oxoacyl-[acyl-carrier-protein] synthase-3
LKALGAGVAIVGSGCGTPETILTNRDLSKIVDTSDEWIVTRTGMKNRRLLSPSESLSEMSARAAKNAIEMARISPLDLDLIILATSTPDDLFGSACQIQNLIGATRAVAFDLTAACSGFVFGLSVASQFIRTGTYQNILLIGADVLSRWVDWTDRTTCVLFGDGAGAVVCQAVAPEENRLLAIELCSDGKQNSSLNLAYRGEEKLLTEDIAICDGEYRPITMNGREVYRFAVAKVPEILEKTLFRANLTVDNLDWLILHQANQRIMDAVAERLGLPSEKVISNVASYGNTSAASIPLALNEAVREGKIKSGDTLAISGFGAGLTWGAAIFQWG